MGVAQAAKPGGDVVLVGVPRAPFAEFSLKIKAAFPDLNVMTVGYPNGVMRPIPIAEDISQKGYAEYGSCRSHRRLPLLPGAEEKLANDTIAIIRGTRRD